MNQEIWKDIPWYEWKYQASTLWNIRWLVKKVTNQYWVFLRKNKQETYLKYNIDHKWYWNVSLYKDWISKYCKVHRLVCRTFLENPENKPQVNHINWIKTDNRVENLEWCTNQENQRHAFDILWKKWPWLWRTWKLNSKSKIIIQYSKKWDIIWKYYWAWEASRKTWFYKWNISSCCLWKLKTYKWFIWKYDEV